MKWVKVRHGTYKYVSDDDSRPPAKLPNKKMGTIYIPFQPSWGKYEKDIWNDDYKTSKKASDQFIAEREREIHTSSRAARWEASRKERWDKDKPAWRKKARKAGIYDR